MSSSQNDEGNGGGDQQGSTPCAAMPSSILLPTVFSYPTDSSRATRMVLSTELCIMGSILTAEITAVLGRTLLITDPPGSFHQLQVRCRAMGAGNREVPPCHLSPQHLSHCVLTAPTCPRCASHRSRNFSGELALGAAGRSPAPAFAAI